MLNIQKLCFMTTAQLSLCFEDLTKDCGTLSAVEHPHIKS